MKKIDIKIRELILSNTKQPSGCETFVYEPANIEEENLGNLYIIGWVKNKKKEMEFLPNLIASIAKREFYNLANNDPETSFENCLKKLNATFLELGKDHKNLRKHISFCIINTSENTLRFSQVGEHLAYLFRNGSLININKTKQKKDIFSAMTSGEIKKGDRFIFSTSKISDIFSEKSIKKILSYDIDKQVQVIDKIYKETSKEIPVPSQAVLVLEARDPKEEKNIKNIFGVSKKIKEIKTSQQHETKTNKSKTALKIKETIKEKKWFLISLSSIIIIIIAVSFYIKYNSGSKLEAEIKNEINTSLKIAETNKQQAINNLKSLKETINTLSSYPFFSQKAKNLNQEVEKNINEINGIFNITDIKGYGKISGKSFGFTPRYVFENEGDIYVFSDSVNLFYKIPKDKNSGFFIFLDDVNFETERAFDDGVNFIFINYENKEVYLFDPSTETMKKLEDEKITKRLLRLKPSNYNKEFDEIKYTLDKNQIVKRENLKNKTFNFLKLIRINDFIVSDDRKYIYLLSEREVFRTDNR